MTAPNERLALSAALLACLLACAPLLSAAQGAPDDLAPRTDGTDGNGTDPLPTAPPITSVCNPDSLTGTDPPEPCTKEQEAAALADLAADMPSSQDVLAAVFDTSTCDPADPGGYTEAVDLSGACAAAAQHCCKCSWRANAEVCGQVLGSRDGGLGHAC